ncbi:MAG: class I SAM-dependent methyltransferase [Streptosporangiaceae bacterium]|jgi:ubiquinone/menaquinone biosynthesis C-methylase UbiE
MPDAVSRFSGFAAQYDAARPKPPADLVALISQWAGTAAPDVVDVGAGTGLSTVIWADRARQVTAVEPSAQMREVARRKTEATAAATATRFTLADGTAEDTGLPDGCADIVTASQAMHWFDAGRALPEITRLLRPGGVFAAYDCDWPPCIDWQTDAAFAAFDQTVRRLEEERGTLPPHAGKRHRETLAASGLFRHVSEGAVHGRDEGDAERVAAVALSQGGAVALLAAGLTEEEIGLTAVREIAARRLPGPRPWWWTYRVRLGVLAGS